ncbi:MAG TPA: YtxH domain-containing protein [Anaerolineales bacterium]|nr:YtxH domain-containing protein [Anaerolineales bacterium]
MSDQNGFGAFAAGLLIGGLSGAVLALLLAPQSGEMTRAQIKEKSIELRDKAQQSAEQARVRADELARQLKEQGQSAVESVRSMGAKNPDSEPAEPAA